MYELVPLPYLTTSALCSPAAVKAWRTPDASTGRLNSTTSSVPPLKSTPQFSMWPRSLMT